MPTRPALPDGAVMLGDDVAYVWACEHSDPAEHTIGCLGVWHWCDHNVWREKAKTDPTMLVEFIPDPGWLRTVVGAHDLIATEPLHLEPSVYWPACCGMHGFIRGGRWTPA